MADPLKRRAQKWTYLAWCDLRNHPFMLLGALVGAIIFALLLIQQGVTNNKVNGVQHAVKVPRRCRVLPSPPPPGTVVLICKPATAREIHHAQVKARATALRAERAKALQRRRMSHRSRTPATRAPREGQRSPNGSHGIVHHHVPSPQVPQGGPAPVPSGGQPSGPPAPGRPSPLVTVPPVTVGPVQTPPLAIPTPSLPLLR